MTRRPLLPTLLTLALALTGCAGAEEEDNPAPPDRTAALAGIYSGDAFLTDRFENGGLTVIDGSGEILSFLPDGSYLRGNLTRRGDDVFGTLHYWRGGLDWSQGSLTGFVETDDSLLGEIALTGSVRAEVLFAPIPHLYQRNADWRYVSGTWSEWDASAQVQTTFTITPDGTVSGSDSTGCLFAGQITIPDLHHNLYRVSLNAERCEQGASRARQDETNGIYSGFALLTADDRLVLLVDNGKRPFLYTLSP